MATKSKAVAAKEAQALAEYEELMQEDAGAGSQNIGASDLAIPFLVILQSGSPQCKRSEGAYIQGAEEGMFLNTVNGALYPGDEGVWVIPCGYEKYVVEWVPRTEGGGLVAQHKPSDELTKSLRRDPETGRFIGPNGNHFVDTGYHYVIQVLGEGESPPLTRAVIGLSSTQLKASRRWNSIIVDKVMERDGQKFTMPSFAYAYHMTSEAQSNARGAWMGWSLGGGGEDDLVLRRYGRSTYLAAREFAELVKAGMVQVSAPPVPEAEASTDDSVV